MARQGKARVLEPIEFLGCLTATEKTRHKLRNKALFFMSFFLALRACELRRLRLYDVLESDGLTIKKMVNLLKTMTKKKKQRHVPLVNEQVRAALTQYLNERREKLDFDLYAPLFPSQKGGEFKPNTIVMLFRRIYDMAGLNDAKSHSGRVTFITLKSRQGIDIKTLRDFAGHEDVNTTLGYIEADPLRLQRAAEQSIF